MESDSNENLDSSWHNAFGVSASCTALRARFSIDEVERVRKAAPKGEFLVAAFAGPTPLKIYKIKSAYLKSLGLDN